MMKLVKVRVLQLSSLSLLIGGIYSCSSLAQIQVGDLRVSVTNIAAIQPGGLSSTVYLKGRVESLAPFLGSGAYELQDATGKIWVIAPKTLPAKGDEVVIKGEVRQQSIPIDGQEAGEVYIQEQEQLERKPAPSTTPENSPILPEGGYGK